MTGFTDQLPDFGRSGFGDVPVGAVIAYAGALGPAASPPAAAVEPWGWTPCDGRSLETGQYPELFAVLGYLYGGSGNTFCLPDYRGYFLRGVDPDGKVDPDGGSRTPPAGGGAPESVGSTQEFAVQDHEHQYVQSAPAGVQQQGDDSGVPGTVKVLTEGGPTNAPGSPTVLTSPHETRPVNVYVNFVIKFTAALRPTGT